jgi:phospholipase/carboxylesterase
MLLPSLLVTIHCYYVIFSVELSSKYFISRNNTMPSFQQSDLSYIAIDPVGAVQKSIIWLHGLGASGHDFAAIVPELHLPAALGLRFIFPHAPVMPITINNGYAMPAWYDILGLDLAAKIDRDGIMRSAQLVGNLIKQEAATGVATENIILAGFSQGAAMALTMGLSYPQSLGGILALSGYMPLAEETLRNMHTANQETPVFIAHGTEDSIVPYALGKAAYVGLKQHGHPVTWRSYAMSHTVCAEEIGDISGWLQGLWR